MSALHPDPQELLQLLDGEATENRAAALRDHLAACATCVAELEAQRRLVERMARPMAGQDERAALDRLLARLDEAPVAAAEVAPSPRAPAWRRPGTLAAAGAGLVAAAAAALLLVPGRPASPPDEFLARGGATAWSRTVGVTLSAVDPPGRLAPGATVSQDTAFLGGWRNAGQAPAFLLAFAIDAAGEVHWLYPAFLAAGTDPASVRLDPTGAGAEAPLPEVVELDRPAPGRLRCIFVVTRAPLAVSAIEGLPAAEREPEALRRHWPDAAVTTLDLTVAPSAQRPGAYP